MALSVCINRNQKSGKFLENTVSFFWRLPVKTWACIIDDGCKWDMPDSASIILVGFQCVCMDQLINLPSTVSHQRCYLRHSQRIFHNRHHTIFPLSVLLWWCSFCSHYFWLWEAMGHDVSFCKNLFLRLYTIFMMICEQSSYAHILSRCPYSIKGRFDSCGSSLMSMSHFEFEIRQTF